MKNLLLLFILITNIVNSETVKFQNISIDSAIKMAQKKDKLILIDYYTDWCIPCKELEKHIFNDDTISEYINTRFICLKVNAEDKENQHITDRYNLTEAYPTVIILTSEGIEIDRLVGLYPKEDYFQDIKNYSKGKNTFEIQKDRIKNEPTNYNLILTLAKKYHVRADTINALKYFLIATEHDDGSKDAMNYYMASFLYSMMGKNDKAIMFCQKAIELEPDFSHYKKFMEKLKSKEN